MEITFYVNSLSMKTNQILVGIVSCMCIMLLVNSCAPTKRLKPVTSISNESIYNYKYVYITPTSSLTSGSGITVSGQYISSSNTVNPSDVISGILTKQGLIRLPELNKDRTNETLIVNYGESGRRNFGLGGYTIEVTIQFITAANNTLVCSCTAEGIGSTEANDIRSAITRCLNEVIKKKS